MVETIVGGKTTMHTPDQQKAINAFLTAANYCAPNGKVQRAFVNMLFSMENENIGFEEIMKNLAGALHDGLAHGNWPSDNEPRKE